MTDWWSTASAESRGEPSFPVREHVEEVPAVRPPEPEAESAKAPGPRRGRGKSLAVGAVGAALAGVVLFSVVPGGEGDEKAASGQQAPSQGAYLPPAGDMPSEAAQEPGGVPRSPQVVTLHASPSGSGSVGAVVEVTITNGTEGNVLVMSSMVKGDGQSAIIGEGTLAPGSREVGPGETVTGTVEFAAKKSPAQIVLMDIGGNVVAASE